MDNLPAVEVPLVTGGMDVEESNRYLLLKDVHPTLEDIYVLEELLRTCEAPARFVVKLYDINGVAAREMLIPKGSYLVGKMHAHDQITVITKGDITVMTEDGIVRLKAPFVMANSGGVKRAGFAHEDTIFMTFHHNPENLQGTDLENFLIAPMEQVKLLEKQHELA